MSYWEWNLGCIRVKILASVFSAVLGSKVCSLHALFYRSYGNCFLLNYGLFPPNFFSFKFSFLCGTAISSQGCLSGIVHLLLLLKDNLVVYANGMNKWSYQVGGSSSSQIHDWLEVVVKRMITDEKLPSSFQNESWNLCDLCQVYLLAILFLKALSVF